MNLEAHSKKFKAVVEKTKRMAEGIEIVPLRDFPSGIHHNETHIENIKEGEPVTIPRLFLPNMVTEGVIKSIPKEG